MRLLDKTLFHDDFVDFLDCLLVEDVDSIIVGGYAVVLHGYHRVTGDLDIWVEPTSQNYEKLMQAFRRFGLPSHVISETDFLDTKAADVFTFGRPPVALDLLTSVKGLDFKSAYAQAETLKSDKGDVKFLHLNHLKEAKRCAGRHKDLNDLENLP
jgi:hypothetical protein